MKSPDGRRTAFVHRDAAYVVCVAEGARVRVVFDAAHPAIDNPITSADALREAGILGLAFSPDGASIYFLMEAWGTSHALYSVDVESGRAHFVHASNGYSVIAGCRDRTLEGLLAVYHHSYFDPMPTSAFDWYLLVEPSGAVRGPIGPSDENVARFLAKRCGSGQAPPDPPHLPPAWKDRFVDTPNGGPTVVYRPVALLDGTELERFIVIDKADGTPANWLLGREETDRALAGWGVPKGFGASAR